MATHYAIPLGNVDWMQPSLSAAQREAQLEAQRAAQRTAHRAQRAAVVQRAAVAQRAHRAHRAKRAQQAAPQWAPPSLPSGRRCSGRTVPQRAAPPQRTAEHWVAEQLQALLGAA